MNQIAADALEELVSMPPPREHRAGRETLVGWAPQHFTLYVAGVAEKAWS